MKHNRELIEAIHSRTFNGLNVLKEIKGNSYAIIEFLVEIDTLMGLMEKHYLLPLFHKDQDGNAYAYVYDEIVGFYIDNPKLINDRFTLVDNYYHVDFSIIIGEIEAQAKQDILRSDND
jgi:hypothetical protein